MNFYLTKKHLSFIFNIAILMLPILAKAQTRPAWEGNLQSTVYWQKLTPLGNLLVGTSKGIQCINVETGSIAWAHNAITNVNEDGCEPIDNSPFVSLTTSEKTPTVYIIEPFSGDILFSSKDAGLENVLDKFFAYKSKVILVLGNEPGSRGSTMAMIDMTTGKKMWSKDNDFGLISSYYDLGGGQLLFATAFFIYKIDAKTGDVLWKQSLDPTLAKMSGFMSNLDKGTANVLSKEDMVSTIIVPDNQPDAVYIGAQQKTKNEMQGMHGAPTTVTYTYKCTYMGYKLSNGDFLWKKAVKTEGKMGVILADKKGLIVCAKETGFINMLDYSSGDGMWSKKGGFSSDGAVLGTAPIAGGTLISCKKGDDGCSLNILDAETGTLKFSKQPKMDGFLDYAEQTPAGLLVATNKEVNLLNTSTGTFKFEKELKSSSDLIATKDNTTYIFSTGDHLLYKLDRNSGNLTPLGATKLEFQGKEQPTHIEIRDKGVLLFSDQNIALLNFNGEVVFNKYYKAPGQSGLTKALLIASAVRSAYYTAAFSYTSAAFGEVSQSIQVKDQNSRNAKDVTGAVSGYFGDAAQSGLGYTTAFIAAATKRFKASAQTQDFVFIMIETDQKKYALIQVDKNTGEKISSIDLSRDKTPSYQVDGLTNAVYYKNGDNTIQKYQF